MIHFICGMPGQLRPAEGTMAQLGHTFCLRHAAHAFTFLDIPGNLLCPSTRAPLPDAFRPFVIPFTGLDRWTESSVEARIRLGEATKDSE